MKKIAMVIMVMALCAIGLTGCNTTSVFAPGPIINPQGDVNQSQDNSNTVDTDLDANVNSNTENHPNNPGTSTAPVELTPFSLAGWNRWPQTNTLTTVASGNECTISSRGRMSDSEGIVNEHLGTFLGGKTLVLHFSNTKASSFHDGRMIKVEADNTVILPPASMFPIDGFLPVGDTPPNRGVEYKIPISFQGKLNFIFYQATLNDLKITAYYK